MDVKKSWVALLEKRLADNKYVYKVINASISGNTTSQGLSQLPELLVQYKPTITIIELGGNDGLRGLPLNVVKNNLDKLVQLAQNAGSKVLLLGVRIPPNYGQEYTQQFLAIYASFEGRSGIQVVKFFLQDVDDVPDLMQTDRIHPTLGAQSTMLNNVWPSLESMLKS